MVENVMLLFTEICVFLSITEMHNVQLQQIQNPCPDITPPSTIEHATGDAFRLQLHCIRDLTIPSGTNITKYKESVPELQLAQLLSVPDQCPDITQRATIADMCTTDFAYEEPVNGAATVDSVALRVMTHQDGCTCEVSLENHYNIYSVFMRKYDLLSSAAPHQKACGLAIDIDYTSPETFPENTDSIECTKGITTRIVSLSRNGVLYFRSRIIDGDFSRGYCIQIYRQHTTGDNVGIQINCSLPTMQTTQQNNTDESKIQTTQQMTDAAIHDSNVAENGNIRIVIIFVAVIGWCLTSIFAITTLCLYRRIIKQRRNNSGKPNVNAQYQDLHVNRLSSCYSSLNASAINLEQHEHI